jgi:hypothetical protein
LSLIPVAERLVEEAGIDLHIVVEEELEHRYWHCELSTGSLWQEAIHFALERYPVIESIDAAALNDHL